MKLPFNYKKHFFGSILMVSALGHVAAFAIGGISSLKPEVSVVEASNSIAIQIVEVYTEPKPVVEPMVEEINPVLTTEEEQAISEVIQEKIVPKEIVVEEPEVVDESNVEAQPTVESKQVETPVNHEVGARVEAVPDVIQNEPPVYPSLAREHGWEGIVYLRIRVGTDGNPESVHLDRSSGHRILDRAALRAVKKWKFIPARLGNVNLESEVRIPIEFVLEN